MESTILFASTPIVWVWGFGRNTEGQLGHEIEDLEGNTYDPTRIPDIKADTVWAGGMGSIIISTDVIYTCGRNHSNSLGHFNLKSVDRPTPLPPELCKSIFKRSNKAKSARK